MNITALLPMKGHSSRVPGKNLRLCAGKPLCHWIIESLLLVDSISKIIIDTDSEEIVRACQSFKGVEFLRREQNLRGDDVSMNKIIAHNISLTEGDHFLQTHATNPRLSSTTIKKAIDAYMSKLTTYDSLFTVNELHTRLYDKDFHPVNHDPENLIPTQELDPLYEENSCLYIFSRSSFESVGRRIGSKPQLFPTPKVESVDIDTEDDFVIAESLLMERGV